MAARYDGDADRVATLAASSWLASSTIGSVAMLADLRGLGASASSLYIVFIVPLLRGWFKVFTNGALPHQSTRLAHHDHACQRTHVATHVVLLNVWLRVRVCFETLPYYTHAWAWCVA